MKKYIFVLIALGAVTGLLAQDITQAEYFINTDPGIGEATPINNFSPDTDISTLLNITGSLSHGFHVIGLRSKDNNGAWSHTNFSRVLILRDTTIFHVVDAEYFIDSDPGIGMATPIPGLNTTLDTSLLLNITEPLSTGFHIIGLRTQDANNSWSHTNLTRVLALEDTVYKTITKVEFFWVSDPGFNDPTNGDTVLVQPISDLAGGKIAIEIPPGLPTGDYALFMRSLDSEGSWSHTQLVEEMSICPSSYVSYITDTVCSSYTAPSGQVYTASGIYRDYLTSTAGCDSSFVIDLTVLDEEPPVILSSHDDQILNGDEADEAILPDYTADVVATDLCDTALEISQSPLPGTVVFGPSNTVTLTVTDNMENSTEVSFNVEVLPMPEGFVELTVFLEGPYNGNSMNTFLNIFSLLPESQPYGAAPWNYSGTESTSSMPENTVDWVFIELRDAPDAASAIAATVVNSQAALLLSDGSVVDPTTLDNLRFNVNINSNLFVVVYHRNHLPVMSSGPLPANGDVYSWDFTDAASKALGGEYSQNEMEPGIWGMIPSNPDANQKVDNQDKNDHWVADYNTTPGYLQSDFDFNAFVNMEDKDIWISNAGKASLVP